MSMSDKRLSIRSIGIVIVGSSLLASDKDGHPGGGVTLLVVLCDGKN